MSRVFTLCFFALVGLTLVTMGVHLPTAWLQAAPVDAPAAATEPAKSGKLRLNLRTRVETSPKSGRYHALTRAAEWDAKKTAIVVCDMWDKHWCPTSTARVGEMARRMNEVLVAARKQGVLIIHCPSDTMDFYKDAPQRKLAQSAPKVATKRPLERWCRIDAEHEAALPIDDTDGGCDAPNPPKSFRAWSRQIATLKVEPGDAVTDSDEAYYLMRQRGIDNVIVMGVHTNMCVLGRPFSIRQMVYQGQNVVLMRDMTDTMYNPERSPFVSHFTGTDLVIEHIEKYWCPSITSADFLGGKPFKFAGDTRKHLVILAAEDEYKTEESLPPFALKQLGRDFRVSFVFADAKERNTLPGLEVLDDADAVLVSVRRRGLPPEQMTRLKKFVASGRGVIGIRTASHAFSPFKNSAPKRVEFWEEFDADILGGHYTGHHGGGAGAETVTWIAPGAEKELLLTGVAAGEFPSAGSLYKTSPLAADAKPLLLGRSGSNKMHEPVAWSRMRKDGGRTFYTSLGHVEDFKTARFNRLLVNGIYWAAGLDVPKYISSLDDKAQAAAGSNTSSTDAPKQADKKSEAAPAAAPKKPDAKPALTKPDGKGHQKPTSKPLPAEESAKLFELPDDLDIKLVLAEPIVKQPVFMTFDERGRLWVVQYLQYPFPAGLKLLSRDNYWRTQYDKVPPPPPNHFVGRDKITIHEDSDGDGTFDKHKTFVDGLNIATAVAPGRGGVWVLNPPYLLFYPDRNHDDVPDGDPEVHLAGFGLEDTHSVVNSLCWGPDGWLYAAQGSTVSAAIKRPGLDKTPVNSMGQHIWRYHPETKRYEIFSEGGGNAFGVEIDAQGRTFSGHNGGDTRGFHYVQGGYLQKGFSKHGPLSNPFAFGYFPQMKHDTGVQRFTHNFIVYEGGKLPEKYNGCLFGVCPLLNYVCITEMSRAASTYTTKDIGYVKSKDPWFRPVDVKLGPDGAVYVADWYDSNVSHLRNSDGDMDASNGRIWRIQAKNAKPAGKFDLAKMTDAQLVEKLSDPNRWFRRTAQRILADRADAKLVPMLTEKIASARGQTALELLWALYTANGGGLNEATATKLIEHAEPQVRLWTIRLMGDAKEMPSPLAHWIAELAATEKDLEVRVQMACTARRIPAAEGLPIVRALASHAEDVDDPRQPLLLWWAIEARCAGDRDAVLRLFEDKSLWSEKIAAAHLLSRVMKRFAMSDVRNDQLVCAKLLHLAPDDASAKALLRGFEEAFAGRSMANLPEELVEALATRGGGSIIFGLRQGKAEAIERALAVIADAKADKSQRLQYVQVFAEINSPRCVPELLKLAGTAGDGGLRSAALAALATYKSPEIPTAVIDMYSKLPNDVAAAAQLLLASRKDWAKLFVEAVEAGKIDPVSVSINTVRRLQIHNDAKIDELVKSHWGDVQKVDVAEMKKQTAHMVDVVRTGIGTPYAGKKLFMEHCGKCHTLFGTGGKIGPDLTTYKRDDLESMMLSVVHPSAEIREGFENLLVLTDDGRALNGLLMDRDNQVVVLRGADGQNIVIKRSEIEIMRPMPRSIMPEGLLKPLNEQQIRDLFAYLRSTQPLND